MSLGHNELTCAVKTNKSLYLLCPFCICSGHFLQKYNIEGAVERNLPQELLELTFTAPGNIPCKKLPLTVDCNFLIFILSLAADMRPDCVRREANGEEDLVGVHHFTRPLVKSCQGTMCMLSVVKGEGAHFCLDVLLALANEL